MKRIKRTGPNTNGDSNTYWFIRGPSIVDSDMLFAIF